MGKRTPRLSILTRIFVHTGRVGDALFARADARARDCGWEVTRSRSGLHRTYRDPRFDLLHRCPRCNGAGSTLSRDYAETILSVQGCVDDFGSDSCAAWG